MSVNPHYIWLLLIVLLLVSWKSTYIQDTLYGRGPEHFEAPSVPATSFDVTLRSSCRADEQDMGENCIKVGCPTGFERGRGPGSDLCYPLCQAGYESNGMSRCYEQCPKGYTTQGTQCIRPKYNYPKDIKPCVGCGAKHPQHGVADALSDAWGPVAPEVLAIPVSHYDRIPMVQVRPTVVTTNPIVTHKYYVNDGLNQMSLGDQFVVENFSAKNFDQFIVENFPDTTKAGAEPITPGTTPTPSNDSKVGNNSTTAANAMTVSTATPPTPAPAGHRSGACPPGYTLYKNNQCYENCPPYYKDLGTHCELDSYIMERQSYDRGAGVSYRSQRKKNHLLSMQSEPDAPAS